MLSSQPTPADDLNNSSVKKFYGLRGGYHPLIALEEEAASRAQGLSEEEQAEAKPGRHLPPGLGGVKKPWRYYHKISENREQKEAKSNPCSVSSLAPRRPEEKKDILKDALPDVKAYVNFARSQKPSLSARIKALNLSPEEETVFEKFEDAITREYMDVPLLWAEEHYDISTLQNWLNRKEEKEGNPFSRTPFVETALGSCRKLYGEADSTIKKYEQDRETKRIANFDAHQELCPKIWRLSYEECEQELAKLSTLAKPIERFEASDKQGIPLDEKGSSICLRILTHPDLTLAQKQTLVYYALDKLSYADYPHTFFTPRFAKLQTDLSWLHHKLYLEALAKPSRAFNLQEENTIWHYFIDHYPDSLFMLLHSMLAHQYPNLIGFVGIWRHTVAPKEDVAAINAFFIKLLRTSYGKNLEFDNALKKMISHLKQDDMQGVYQLYAEAGLDNEVPALFEEWHANLKKEEETRFCFAYQLQLESRDWQEEFKHDEAVWTTFVAARQAKGLFDLFVKRNTSADIKMKFLTVWAGNTRDPKPDADVISAFYRSNKLIDASQDEAFEANETLLWRQLTALDPNQGKKLFMDLVASYCNETKLLHFIHVWMSPLDPAMIRRHYNETIKPVITAERCRFEKYLPEITRLTQKPILEKAANKVVIDPSTQEWMTSGFSFFKYFDRPGPNDRYKQICKQPAAAQSIIAAEEKELAEAINNKLKASPGNSVFKFK